MSQRQQRLMTFIGGALLVLLFLIISTSALVWAHGLRFDPASRTFQQTAVIAVKTKLSNVEVWLNGRLLGSETPLQERNLPPGRYTVRLEKPGYYPWIKTFELSGGQVGLIDETTTLIARTPLVTPYKASPSTFKPVSLFDVGLSLELGELIDQGKLVTRFASDPVQIHRLATGYIYQVGAELRVFFVEGNQDYLIHTLSNAQTVPMMIFPATWQVVIQENNQFLVINLTVPNEPSVKSSALVDLSDGRSPLAKPVLR